MSDLHRFLILCLTLSLLTGCASSSLHTRKKSLPLQLFSRPAPFKKSSFQKQWTQAIKAKTPILEQKILQLMKNKQIPGAAVGLVVGQKLIWAKGFGHADIQKKWKMTTKTVGRIGSVTKVFTSIALMKLQEEGLIALDDPVARVLPELSRVLYPTRDSPRITYRHLMTHSSGLPRVGGLDYYSNPAKPVTDTDIIAALKGARILFAPGTKTLYSNLAVAVAGLAISRILKSSYATVITQRVLKPLGMTQSVWSRGDVSQKSLATGYLFKAGKMLTKPHWNMGSATAMGGLYSNVDDMTRFIRWQISAWPPSNAAERGPLRRSTLRISQLPLAGGPSRGNRFGANWITRFSRRDGLVISHTGSTHLYSTSVQIRPQAGIGLVVMANRAHPSSSMISKIIWKAVFASRPIRKTTVHISLKKAIRAFLQQLESPSIEIIQKLFSNTMLKFISAKKLFKMFTGIRKDLGSFKIEKILQKRQGVGFIILRFKKTRLKVMLVVETISPYRIKGMSIKPHKK